MKFLLITSYKDTMTTLPIAVSRKISEALIGWVGQQKQAGLVLESYVIPAWKRTVLICEFESADQITQVLPGMPGFGFMDFEVYPLADFEGSVTNMVEAIKKLEQMMPKE